MLERLRDNRAGLNLDEKFVPSTMLYAFIGGCIVGRLSLRHTLNDHLRERGGHVGYSVAPKFRRRGYATEILKQTLPFCRRVGLNTILLTCSDDNVGSWRVIEQMDGVLTDKVMSAEISNKDAQELARRYWLKIPGGLPKREQPVLKTANLTLRPFTLADAKRVQRLANDEKISATTTLPHPYPPGMAEDWIAKQESDFSAGLAVHYAVIPNDVSDVVGVVSLFAISKPHQRAELGYWIGVDYWNKGYCTEAVKALIEYGFGNLDLNKISANFLSSNIASGKVMTKAGMSQEEVLREQISRGGNFHDSVCFGITRSGKN